MRALITGITGQDGSYLAELLLSNGYDVHGLMRRGSSFTTGRIEHILSRIHTHYGDMTDGTGLRRVLELVQPTEVYNLAAQSHVRVSFDQPEYSVDVGAVGTLRLLDAVRDMRAPIRFYQASSSEMFGSSPAPQDESTPFHPRSPYAVAKCAAHWHAVNYREAYGMFVSCGILFNHTSPRRGETFVCRKITRAVARARMGLQSTIALGNLDARRDWGFAGDYVDAMHRMLRVDRPCDVVVATGRSVTVREFLALAMKAADLGELRVERDSRYERPAEVERLNGDASLASRLLGWKPRMTLEALIAKMVHADMQLARGELR